MNIPRKVYLPLVFALGLGVVAALVLAQKMKLPKPQGTFVEGQAAPDFTLKDQDGNPFHLADARGTRTLLIFYRGYW
jgi:cytochrome oxidase Cu insertion factor (SCO1/SenC/PrrC family)